MTRGKENRLGEGADGTLAVGSRDMEATEFLLRISEHLKQALHPLQTGLNTPGLHGHEPIEGCGVRRHAER